HLATLRVARGDERLLEAFLTLGVEPRQSAMHGGLRVDVRVLLRQEKVHVLDDLCVRRTAGALVSRADVIREHRSRLPPVLLDELWNAAGGLVARLWLGRRDVRLEWPLRLLQRRRTECGRHRHAAEHAQRSAPRDVAHMAPAARCCAMYSLV